MTLAAETTIDLVAHDPTRDEALLVMVHDRPWGDTGHSLPVLQAKFNTYLEYITSGQLIRDYPNMTGKAVHIQLRSTESPGERELGFLRIIARQHLQPAGTRLTWRVVGEQSEHGI